MEADDPMTKLTKLEYIAIMAMKGMVTDLNNQSDDELMHEIPRKAILVAKHMIKEFNNNNNY